MAREPTHPYLLKKKTREPASSRGIEERVEYDRSAPVGRYACVVPGYDTGSTGCPTCGWPLT